jgi:diguanylate cyclase (GGDEF)-like protein
MNTNEKADPAHDPQMSRGLPRHGVIRTIRVSLVALGGLTGILFFLIAYTLGKTQTLTTTHLLVCVLEGVLIGVGSSILVSLSISREIRRLADGMKRINRAVAEATDTGSGWADDHRLAITSSDDVGDVERAFNEMTEAVAHRLRLEHNTCRLLSQLGDRVEPKAVGRVILDELMQTGDTQCGLLYGRTDRDFTLLAALGVDNGGTVPDSIDAGEGPTGRALQTDQIQAVEPERHGFDWIEMPTPLGRLRPATILIVPLQLSAETVGVALLASAAEGASREQSMLLESLRVRSATHLQNALLQKKLRELTAVDELTGLLNRRFGMRRLQEEFSLAIRYGMPVSAVLVDMDHFAAFNATHGQDAGDAMLRRIGSILDENLRSEDIICRHDGAEFIIAAPGTGPDEILIVAEKLRQLIELERLPWQGQELAVTVSLGVAAWPMVTASTPEALITHTDQALHHAKNAGRNRVAVHRGMEIEVMPHDPKAKEPPTAA